MKFEKKTGIAIVILLICLAFTPCIDAKFDKTAFESESSESVHLFSFVESGYVQHRNMNCSGIYFSYPFCFCIGSVKIDLSGFQGAPEEPRLTVKSISGTTTYEENVSVVLRGFIGRVQPTGHISGGFLKGHAVIAKICLLE